MQAIFFAAFGGVLPAILWLWFWLREDSVHPEPKSLIFMTFIAGVAAVLFVLPFQKIAYTFFQSDMVFLFFIWAVLEELFKFGAAYIVALRSKAVDEPVDVIIYMLTAALGFVALENTLFLIDPLVAGNVVDSIITGNLRFVGASLLHVMSSGIVGIFMAFSFHKDKFAKRSYTIFGLILAVILHTMFNLSIIDASGGNTFIVFSVLWLSVVGLLLFFEKIKRLEPKLAIK